MKWKNWNEARARARATTGTAKISKAERARWAELTALFNAHEIVWFEHEAIRFVLAKNCVYTPDFLVVEADRSVRVEEVKGSRGFKLDDEGRTKWKVAAERFPLFRFVGLSLQKSGRWDLEEYEPAAPFPHPGQGATP